MEAKRVFDDAQRLLKDIIQRKRLVARAVVAYYPARSNMDDIEILNEDRSEVIAVLHGLRQQVYMAKLSYGHSYYYAILNYSSS